MKLTTGIYHNKVFQLAKSFGVSHRVCDDVNKKTLMYHLACHHWSKM